MSNERQLKDFMRAYMEAMLWAETGDDGEPLDRDYDIDDFSGEALRAIEKDCIEFLDKAGAMISEEELPGGRSENFSAAGHDFWLTRHHHGAGFWDGDWPIHGDELTKLSQSFKDGDVYAGDDNKIYFM